MEMNQIYQVVNSATKETIGDTAVVNEDLSNIVDIGTAVMNARSFDKFVGSLVDHIGKMIFVNRPYKGSVPSVLRDGWEYGAILQKVSGRLYEATENESWELQDGTSYDPNIFYKPDVIDKFFNKRTTWEIPCSFADRQARSAVSNASQMNSFLSMIMTDVENSRTVKIEDMVMRTINAMIGSTFYDMNSSGTYTGAGNMRCVNLLKLYNDRYDKTLTAADCVEDREFIRYAAYILMKYKRRIAKISKLFNIGGQPRFTSADRLHTIMHADFVDAAGVFLQSDTFHKELVSLPQTETVPYWQGSGTTYDFADTSKIDIVLPDEVGGSHPTVTTSGILGVMFDHDSLGICNESQRVTTNYNPKAEFFTNWWKVDTAYFNDHNENFVVFYAA